jgi:hypothetical protein
MLFFNGKGLSLAEVTQGKQLWFYEWGNSAAAVFMLMVIYTGVVGIMARQELFFRFAIH